MASNNNKDPLEGVNRGNPEIPDDIHAMIKEAEIIDNEEAGFNHNVDEYWSNTSQELPPKPVKSDNHRMSAHAYKELKKTVKKQEGEAPSKNSSVLDRFKNLNQEKASVDPNLVNDLKKSLSNNSNSNAATNTNAPKAHTTISKLEQPDNRTELRQIAATNLENLTKTGELATYDDAVKALEKMGLDISRKNRTGGSISVSHPELVDKNGRPIKARIKTSDLNEDAANIVFKESLDRKAKKALEEKRKKAAVKFTEVNEASLMKNDKQGVPNKPLSLSFPPPPDVNASLTDKVKKSEKLSLSNNSSYASDHINSSMNLYKHPSTSGIASSAPKYAGSGVVASTGTSKSPKPKQPSQYKTTPLNDKKTQNPGESNKTKKNTKSKNAKYDSKKDVSQKNKDHPNHPKNAGKPNTGVVDGSEDKKQSYSSNAEPERGSSGNGFTLGANVSGVADATSRAASSGSKVISRAYQGVRNAFNGNGANQQTQGLFDSLDSSNPAHNLPNLTKQALSRAHNANLTSQEALLDIERGGLSPSEQSARTRNLNDGFRDYAEAGNEAARSLETNKNIDSNSREAGTKLLEGMQKDVVKNSQKAKTKNLLDKDNKDNLADKLDKIKEMIERVMRTIKNIANAAMALAGRRP